jgi:uncharacterized membrane protein (UPF0127 family)
MISRSNVLAAVRQALCGVVLGGVVLSSGCGSDEQQVMKEPEFLVEGTLDFVRSDGTPFLRIAVELAETHEEQLRGLMGRRSLPSKGGMLFVYPQAIEQSFWMKNTPLPLDIVFIAEDSTIVNIARRTRPLSEETIRSSAPAQYVLELRAGFVDRYGIDEATRIEWQRIDAS